MQTFRSSVWCARLCAPSVFAALCLSLVAALPASAQDDEWSSVGALDGENVTAFAVDPTDSEVLYAGLSGANGSRSGVLKTTDGGSTPSGISTWREVNDGLHLPGRMPPDILALTIDPSNPQIVYAGTREDGVFKSTDGAENWTPARDGMEPLPGIVDVNALAIDPTAPRTIYAGATAQGLYKSTNGGETWIPRNNGFGVGAVTVVAVAIDPSQTETIYVGTTQRGVFKSTDGAANWSPVNSGLPEEENVFPAIAIDPMQSQTLYVTADVAGVFKSTNGGMTWSPVNAGLNVEDDFFEVGALVIDEVSPQVLYVGRRAALSRGVFKTTNGGASWVENGLDGNVLNLLVGDPSIPHRFYAATTSHGVFATQQDEPLSDGCSVAPRATSPFGVLAVLALLAGVGRAFHGPPTRPKDA